MVDLHDGRVVFERDATRPLIPASNQKIFALAAALDLLGPDFVFKTRLARCGNDLVVVGDGDPAIGDSRLCEQAGEPITATFERWAVALSERGVKTIAGDLVIDETSFDSTLVHPTWSVDDLQKWYAAPVGGLNFHDNVIEVTVWPDEKAGEPVRWAVTPKTGLVQIDNRARSGGSGATVIARPSSDFRYVLSGACQKRGTLAEVTVPDPGLFFADALRTVLSAKGIAIDGDIVRRRVRTERGELRTGCEMIATHATPLTAVLARIGKNSQNMFAECLLKRLGYARALAEGDAHPVGSWDTGRAAIEAFLRKVDPSGGQVTIADASGLSRENSASAADFTRVLAYMYASPHRQAFVDSLSDAGTDGSLAKRMKHVPGSVHAKTGYIRGVRTLSGYVITPRGDWLAFSVLFNGPGSFNEIHDEFCGILSGYSRG